MRERRFKKGRGVYLGLFRFWYPIGNEPLRSPPHPFPLLLPRSAPEGARPHKGRKGCGHARARAYGFRQHAWGDRVL